MMQYAYILINVLNYALRKHSLDELIKAYRQDHEDIVLETLAIDYHYDPLLKRFI
ncbi:MAG: DUF4250 family protein [bacterium]